VGWEVNVCVSVLHCFSASPISKIATIGKKNGEWIAEWDREERTVDGSTASVHLEYSVHVMKIRSGSMNESAITPARSVAAVEEQTKTCGGEEGVLRKKGVIEYFWL
jgi:hypothetical protein